MPEPSSTGSAQAAHQERVEAFLRYLGLERGRSANTLDAYRRDLAGYVDWLVQAGVARPEQASADLVVGYVGQLQGSPRSLQRRVSTIRSFHQFLADHGHSSSNPARELSTPRPSSRLPKALAVETVSALLESVSGDDAASLRDRALLELLYGTGARVGEIVGLALDDAHSVSGGPPELLRVIGKGDRERIVPLGQHARQALDAYVVRARPVLARRAKRPVSHLFLGARGGALSRQSVWLILRSRAEAAGITEEISPHTLRHSCATHLVAGGADIRVVQELLGHQSIQTTQIYTKVTIDTLRDVYYTSHPRARG